MKRRIIYLILFILLLAALGALKHEQRWRYDTIRLGDRITYVPKPEIIKAMSLGYENVVADLLWIRAIQYYGSHFTQMRKYPEDWIRLSQALQALRPNFPKGHEFIAAAMAEGLREPQLAIDYLNKALEENPGAYTLPYQSAMFASMVMQDRKVAAEYMCKAAKTHRVVQGLITVADNVQVKSASTPFEKLPYPHLYFSPGRLKIKTGSDFDLDLLIAGAQRLATSEYVIKYNPAILRVNSVSPDSLSSTINAASGLVHIAYVYPPPGLGKGKLATLSCTAIASGTSSLDVDPLVFKRASNNTEMDIRAPRHLERLCLAYRSQVGDWLLSLRELSKQFEIARSDVERNIISNHINRTLIDIDRKVLNHALAEYMDEYGIPPAGLDELLSATPILTKLFVLSQQTQAVVNQAYLARHPGADPRSDTFIYLVWEDKEAVRGVLKQYPALWEALVPYFKWTWGRDPKDLNRTEEDLPLMVEEMRQVYDITHILNYRFVRKYNRFPNQDEIIPLGYRALEEPNIHPTDPAKDGKYIIIEARGKPSIESTFLLDREREAALAQLNERFASIVAANQERPNEITIPTTMAEFYAKNAPDLVKVRDPYGKEFQINLNTMQIEIAP